MPLEIEAKFLVADFEAVRNALQQKGFQCMKPRTLMKRKTFTLKEKVSSSVHEWARVRDEGDKVTMTYKHTHNTQSAMGTDEIDLTVNNFNSAVNYMQSLGFQDVLHQENYREAWQQNGLQITMDEWPVLGCIVEVEGPSEQAVIETSQALGFDYDQAVFGGVGALYFAKYGKDMGLVKELTFATAPQVETFLNS